MNLPGRITSTAAANAKRLDCGAVPAPLFIWMFRSGVGLLLLFLTPPASAAPITSLAFSPDGAALVSPGFRSVEVRSPTNAAVLRVWECPIPKIMALAFDSKGRHLAVAGGTPGARGDVLLFRWPEGRLVTRWELATDLATGIAFSPAGDRLVVGSANHVAQVWTVPMTDAVADSPNHPQPGLKLEGHAAPILAVAWDPANATLTTASADRSLKVWSPVEGRLIRTFSHHTEPLLAVAFRPRPEGGDADSPAVCASGGEDRTVRIWQPGLGRMVRIIRGHPGPILALAWASDGASLFSACTDGRLRRLDGSSDVLLAEWVAHDDWIQALSVSPDGTRLASGDASGYIRIWDARPGTPVLLHSVGPGVGPARE